MHPSLKNPKIINEKQVIKLIKLYLKNIIVHVDNHRHRNRVDSIHNPGKI